MDSFPYVIVRYERGSDERAGALMVCYARSFEHASDVLPSLTRLRKSHDPTAVYAIRKTVECYASPTLYSCACGGSVGGHQYDTGAERRFDGTMATGGPASPADN